MEKPKISFAAFYLLDAQRRGWKVPDIHIKVCHWLQHRGRFAVLRAHRGFSKSTLLGAYNAWCYYVNPQYRILHQGDQDKTAYKTSRDTKSVLMKHPLTKAWFENTDVRGDVSFWWSPGAVDERNPSMQASGVMSNIVSSRADEVQNDDVEVPRNIANPESREKLRDRLSEQTHILVPGGKKLYVGTPHTHDSLYDEQERLGADCLTIRMFEHEYRIEDAKASAYPVPFNPEFVFAGIGESAVLLVPERDYAYRSGVLAFASPPGGLIDCYSGVAWPERFGRDELELRRRETRTINGWDSQYQLHSKPITDVRLNPDRMPAYSVEPTFRTQNKHLTMWLGKAQIVSARAYWDCATGKVGGDTSALSVILDDARGNHYWHRSEALTGDYAEFSDTQNTRIIGGQVLQAVKIIKDLRLSQVAIETNGVGTFVPKLLQRALKQEGVRCGVKDNPAKGNKAERILSGIEGPLLSGVLWAHISVKDGPAGEQMRDWNPDVPNQADDYIDSGAGALLLAPVRIGQSGGKHETERDDDWRPASGVFEAEFEA